MLTKYSTMVLLLMFITTTALADVFNESCLFQMQVSNPRYIKPFSMLINSFLTCKADSATIDITLTEGLRLLKGHLHQQVQSDRKQLPFEWCLLQITETGIYQISAVLNAYNVKDAIAAKHFPMYDTLYLYAREDTVIWYADREQLEQSNQEKFFLPPRVGERIQDKPVVLSKDQFWEVRRRKKLGFRVLYDSLDIYGSGQRLLLFLKQNSMLPDRNNSQQISLVKQNSLFFSHPIADSIEKKLDRDFGNKLTPEQLQTLTRIVKRQLTEFYELDQQMQFPDEFELFRIWLCRSIGLKQMDLHEVLLCEKSDLLYDQKEERIDILRTKNFRFKPMSFE